MKSFGYFFIFIFLISCSTSQKTKNESNQKEPYVLLISFDGFRHDYVEKYNAPNFKQFIDNGLFAESLLPSFPSKTYPNHYAIITGMYPSTNGLVDNTFYDDSLNLKYEIRNREMVRNPIFYKGLPLWQLVQQNGMKSASYFWVGSETKIAGNYPDKWFQYDGKVENETRIKTVLEWFQLPKKERPRYMDLYFSFTDDIGHKYGPNSTEMQQAVLGADRLLGLIMNGLESIDLDINIIVVSDHGMYEIQPDSKYLIEEEEFLKDLDLTKVRITNSGSHLHFYFDDKTYIEQAYNIIKKKGDFFDLYRYEELPKEWHYTNINRIGELFVAMKPGYYLKALESKNQVLEENHSIGVHGYDPNSTKQIHGIFYANGPQIQSGKKINSFENVHIYPFIAELLGIKSYPKIDGDKNVLAEYINE